MSKPTAMAYRQHVCVAMNFISQNIDRALTLEEIARSASLWMFRRKL